MKTTNKYPEIQKMSRRDPAMTEQPDGQQLCEDCQPPAVTVCDPADFGSSRYERERLVDDPGGEK